VAGRESGRILLRVTPPPGPREWVRSEFTVRVPR
jgi:hypothetical protein